MLDAMLAGLALAGAFLIRFDGYPGQLFVHQLVLLLPLFATLRLSANWAFGVYRRLWRYTGLTEVAELACSVLTVTTAILIARAVHIITINGNHLSYGIIFIECGLAFLLMVTPRVLRRLLVEHSHRRHWRQPIRQRALVVGAGDAGQMVVKELSQRPDLGVDVVGLIDDDPQKLRKKIGHLTVFGTTGELVKLVENLFIDQVVIAIPSAPPAEIRRIVDMCRTAEVETRILPGLYELIDGRVTVSQLREVCLEDLLGREPVELDSTSIAGYIEGRHVLITGAGGSIGSELSRQIMSFQPKELLLLGKGENSIFSIYQELSRRPEPVKLVPLIADVRDYHRMLNIFQKHRPDVVFHAAAHKHVPLMEDNACEAVTNNINGTRTVSELATEYGVDTFVLVSSDKAVNPTSIMGASKRTAELIIQDLSRRSQTKYVAVRFGNVLDSRGSVLPTWRQQIASGGPLTVTHPEATRYFMLIPEAVQLIIQAGAIGMGGEIFVLDMGKPVKILDLAHDLIRLSGLRTNEDIEISFVGLRPGEKLYEELLTAEEGLSTTMYKKILVGKPQPIDHNKLVATLTFLSQAAQLNDELAIRTHLDALVGSSLLPSKEHCS
ncbi:MAG: polysaccharide biosynthesis protein [Candidatus Melainabacteria bacterium]|nr:polysaccharide biosynthesis protein [Candidatus Melainabacteria bacterium]